jgi:hypothetical protein
MSADFKLWCNSFVRPRANELGLSHKWVDGTFVVNLGNWEMRIIGGNEKWMAIVPSNGRPERYVKKQSALRSFVFDVMEDFNEPGAL